MTGKPPALAMMAAAAAVTRFRAVRALVAFARFAFLVAFAARFALVASSAVVCTNLSCLRFGLFGPTYDWIANQRGEQKDAKDRDRDNLFFHLGPILSI